MENTNIYVRELQQKTQKRIDAVEDFKSKNPRPALKYCEKHRESPITAFDTHYEESTGEVSWKETDIYCSICEAQEQREREFREMLSTANIPKRYADVDGSDKYMKSINKEKGVLLIGGVGTGKTYELVALMKHLMSEGKRVKFRTFGEICRQIRDAVGDNEYNDLYDRFLRSDVFVIDDLGVENSTPFIKEFIYNLINDMYNNRKILLMTTNLTSSELLNNYTQRVVSRLNEMCDVVKLDGNDRRKSNL